MHCAAFRVDIHQFGLIPESSDNQVREAIRKECMVLVGFYSFVVTYPRRSGQSQQHGT